MLIVGKRIRQARVLAGLTQEKLAEMIGVSRTAIVRWEAAETEPTLDHLIALTVALHVSADYLLGINDSDQTLDVLTEMVSKLDRIISEMKDETKGGNE